jgi:uncharacterized protein (DUF1684 family)
VTETEGTPNRFRCAGGGTLQLLVIKHGERQALRLKDNNSKERRDFTHLCWYPIQEDWKIKAKFIPVQSPTRIVFDTAIGEQESSASPGYVEFERGGATYRLQAAAEGRGLFFVIRDQTGGKTAYAASRFLYADAPQDFNKAENPPCASPPMLRALCRRRKTGSPWRSLPVNRSTKDLRIRRIRYDGSKL